VGGGGSEGTGVSLEWLLAGDPKKQIESDTDEPYDIERFFYTALARQAGAESKRPISKARKQKHNQIRALLLEHLMDKAINAGNWPVIKMMVEGFLYSLSEAVGQRELFDGLDVEKAAATFGKRWIENKKTGFYDYWEGEERLKFVEAGKLDLPEHVIAQVMERCRNKEYDIDPQLFQAPERRPKKK
jgi:hypothetical protein